MVLAQEEYFGGTFIWNLILFHFQYTKLIGCTIAGTFGLFWFNDEGEMIEHCLLSGQVGARAEFLGEDKDDPTTTS